MALRSGGMLYWLLSDHLGSTAVTLSGTTEAGEVRYRAFGASRFTSGLALAADVGGLLLPGLTGGGLLVRAATHADDVAAGALHLQRTPMTQWMRCGRRRRAARRQTRRGQRRRAARRRYMEPGNRTKMPTTPSATLASMKLR